MENFQFISRQHLNIKKYDDCIKKATNTRIYAFSWYLDVVADQWDILIYGDYQAVMPLPWRKKYGIQYVYMPPWIQQLGVFSAMPLKEELITAFLNEIPKKFKKITLFLNEENKIKKPEVTKRANFLLNLNQPYVQIRENYKKNRLQALNKAIEAETQVKIVDNPERIFEIYRQHIFSKTNLKLPDLHKLKNLIDKLLANNNVYFFESWHGNEMLGGAIFLFDKNRFYYLLSATNKAGKKHQSMSLMLDEFIKNHANSNAIFDFEGSEIPGIASFFKSFGAVKVPYYFYHQPFSLTSFF